MGALILPSSGLVYLDANPIIYSVEKHPVYWPILEPVWQAAKGKTLEIVSSELVLMEDPRCTPRGHLSGCGLCAVRQQR